MNALQIALAVFGAYVAGGLSVVVALALVTANSPCTCKEKR